MKEEKSAAIPAYRTIVILMDGRRLAGRLAHFSPNLGRYHLTSEDGKPYPVPATSIAYMVFSKTPLPPSEIQGLKAGEIQQITLRNGDVLKLNIPAQSEKEHGFFAFAKGTDEAWSCHFIFRHAVERIENIKESEDEEASPRTRKRSRIGRLLLEEGLITSEQLEKALEEQTKRGEMRLGEILVRMGVVSERQITEAIAKRFNLPIVDLDEIDIDPEAVSMVDEAVIYKHQLLPITKDERTITLAVTEPIDSEVYDLIRFQTERRIREVLVTPSQWRKHTVIHLGYSYLMDADTLTEGISIEGEVEEEEEISQVQLIKSAEAPPIVRLVDKILLSALNKGASDIHFLPQRRNLVLAFRIDGDLRVESYLDKRIQKRVISRLKILSGMDISEHRVPQDGRLVVRYKKQQSEFRVSCIPNIYGESMVLRVLRKDVAPEINDLGFREDDIRRLSMLLRKPYGFILVTGPTGSGKSTTLCACLNTLKDLPIHIITIEDPVESGIEGANQVQINPRAGLTFARVLRNVLRHDPDVIMVGEIRDQETAEIATEAALTGHLMLSTLHTYSAVDTVIRLTDLGIPNYLVAPALLGVVNQRLVKRLCPYCRRQAVMEKETQKLLEGFGLDADFPLYDPQGCDRCNQTGYAGRVMLYEFLEVTDPIRRAIHDGVVGDQLQEIALKEGLIPMGQCAIDYARKGIISREELIRNLI